MGACELGERFVGVSTPARQFTIEIAGPDVSLAPGHHEPDERPGEIVSGAGPSSPVFSCSCGWLFPRTLRTVTGGMTTIVMRCPRCATHFHMTTDLLGRWELRETAPTPGEA